MNPSRRGQATPPDERLFEISDQLSHESDHQESALKWPKMVVAGCFVDEKLFSKDLDVVPLDVGATMMMLQS
jgi:hypothetical protein